MDITYVKAVFGSLRKTRTQPVYRDDHDLILQLVGVKGLPVHFQAHFSNTEYGTAVVMMGSDGEVSIPNTLLATGLPVYCWILVEQGISGAVRYSVQIPVRQKARPDGTVPPEQADIIFQAISALNDAGTAAQEAADSAAQNAEYVAGVKDDLYEAIDRVGVLEEAKETTFEAAENAEAWAVGNRGGSAVPSTDPAYHNNAKYYAEQAANALDDLKGDFNEAIKLPYDSYVFLQGRYIAQGTVIGSPSGSPSTVSTSTAISYDSVDFKILIKSGWQLAFPTFINGVQKRNANEFIAGPKVITLEDIKANVSSIGDSFAIMVRTNPAAQLSINDFNENEAFLILPINYSFRGIISEEPPVFSNYKENGIYYVTANAINSVISTFPNAPSVLNGGILEVFSTPSCIIQKYYDTSSFLPVWSRVNLGAWIYDLNRFSLIARAPKIENNAINLNGSIATGMYRIPAGTSLNGAPYDITITNEHQLISFFNGRSNLCLLILIGSEGTWIKREGQEWHRLAYSRTYKNIKWYAIGDSITDGRYSYYDENNVAKTGTDHTTQYNYIASQILNMPPVIEYGYGGMGWLHVANDGTYLTDVLDMDFDNPDLITVCLGVNDRGSGTLGDTNSVANDGTISGAIRNCCVTLATKYPTAQIVFFTPLNASSSGTIDTKWSRQGASKNNLDDIADLIKHWCNFYGFKVIDLLTESPVNSINITTMLPDGLHPSKTAHSIIGHYIAGVLPIRN